MNEKIEIKELFVKAIDILSSDYKGSSLTDVFVLIDSESGELSIYDDEENCIVRDVVDSWIDSPILSSKLSLLASILTEMGNEGIFEKLEVFTPFSINFSDENFIVQEELFCIEDDSMVRFENDFLDRLDKEFDDFLEKLLKD